MKNVSMLSANTKIPLFDIDWTLLKGGELGNKIHHDAFDFVLHNIYHQPNASIKEVMAQGKIDTQILIEVLKLHGVTEHEAKIKLPEAIKAMAKYFKKHAEEGHFELMPGVLSLLNDLKSRKIPLGLLTGNVSEIAWEKLARAGIKNYFSFGAFGSMAYKRIDLIKIARDAASNILGEDLPVSRFVIVGDSPLDIACAREGGIPVIAVGAGHYKVHELAHADLTLNSLSEKGKILKFLMDFYMI